MMSELMKLHFLIGLKTMEPMPESKTQCSFIHLFDNICVPGTGHWSNYEYISTQKQKQKTENTFPPAPPKQNKTRQKKPKKSLCPHVEVSATKIKGKGIAAEWCSSR